MAHVNSGDRIRKIREALNLDQNEMSAKVGILQGSYSSVENGKTGISTKVRKALIEAGVNPDFIDHGREPILKTINAKDKTLPLVPDLAMAGELIGYQDNTNEPHPRFIVPGFKDCDLLVQISGDSMFPLLTAGDIVAIKRITDLQFIKWGSIYVIEHVDGPVVKILKEAFFAEKVN